MCPRSEKLDSRPTVADRRRGQRRRSLLAGKILLVNEVVFDCAIRDISEAGAQIRLTAQPLFPTSFVSSTSAAVSLFRRR